MMLISKHLSFDRGFDKHLCWKGGFFFATIHNLRIEQTFLVIMNQILMHLLIWENYDTNIRNTRLHNGTSMRIQHKGAKPEFYMANISPSVSCSTKACLSHAYLYVNR